MDECNIETPATGPQEPEEPKTRGKSEIEELNNKYLVPESTLKSPLLTILYFLA